MTYRYVQPRDWNFRTGELVYCLGGSYLITEVKDDRLELTDNLANRATFLRPENLRGHILVYRRVR